MKKKVETVNVMSGLEATVMPRYNTHAVGHGLWKSRKDKTRRAEKKETSAEPGLTTAADEN